MAKLINENWLKSIIPTLEKEDIYFFLKFGFISTSNWENFESYFGKFKYRLWFEAAENGDLGIIKFFIEVGVNINEKNRNKKTAFIISAANNRLNVAKFLVEKKADIHISNSIDGGTILMWASERGYFDVVKLLVEVGVNINEKKFNKDTALILAVAYGNRDIARFLIEVGADISIKNRIGSTVLMIAIRKGHMEFIKLLIEKSPDEKKYMDALEMVKNNNKEGLMKLFNIEEPKFKSPGVPIREG